MLINKLPITKGIKGKEAAKLCGISHGSFRNRVNREQEFYALKDGGYISSNKDTLIINEPEKRSVISGDNMAINLKKAKGIDD